VTDVRAPIFAAAREAKRAATGKGLSMADVAAGDAWMNSLGIPRGTAASDARAEPLWIIEGRRHIGEREIPGVRHSAFVLSFWRRWAPWFTTDETPWCGGFIAHCIDAAGLPIPGKGEFARALSWASYGEACPAQPGAIGVKKRQGGNHVYFIIGETPDKRFYKVLHGNASNMVCIGDIAKSDTFAIRWPLGVPQPRAPLPQMAAGTISTNEA